MYISLQAILCADGGFLGLAGNAIDMDNIGIAQKAAGVIFDIIDTVGTTSTPLAAVEGHICCYRHQPLMSVQMKE